MQFYIQHNTCILYTFTDTNFYTYIIYIYIRTYIYARYRMNFNVSFEVPTLKVDFSIQLGRWICSRSILQAEKNQQRSLVMQWKTPGFKGPGYLLLGPISLRSKVCQKSLTVRPTNAMEKTMKGQYGWRNILVSLNSRNVWCIGPGVPHFKSRTSMVDCAAVIGGVNIRFSSTACGFMTNA